MGTRGGIWYPHWEPISVRRPPENPEASRAYAGIIKNELAWAMALGSGNVTESCLSADGIAFYREIVKITSCTWITEDAAPAYKVGRVW